MNNSYTCEQWKKEFKNAAYKKLSGENSEFIQRIINKVSPCSIEIIQQTTNDIIKNHKIETQKNNDHHYSSKNIKYDT